MNLQEEVTPEMELLPTKQQELFQSAKKAISKKPKSAPKISGSKKSRVIKAVVNDKLIFEGD